MNCSKHCDGIATASCGGRLSSLGARTETTDRRRTTHLDLLSYVSNARRGAARFIAEKGLRDHQEQAHA
jgi:hypothetical protein